MRYPNSYNVRNVVEKEIRHKIFICKPQSNNIHTHTHCIGIIRNKFKIFTSQSEIRENEFLGENEFLSSILAEADSQRERDGSTSN